MQSTNPAPSSSLTRLNERSAARSLQRDAATGSPGCPGSSAIQNTTDTEVIHSAIRICSRHRDGRHFLQKIVGVSTSLSSQHGRSPWYSQRSVQYKLWKSSIPSISPPVHPQVNLEMFSCLHLRGISVHCSYVPYFCPRLIALLTLLPNSSDITS